MHHKKVWLGRLSDIKSIDYLMLPRHLYAETVQPAHPTFDLYSSLSPTHLMYRGEILTVMASPNWSPESVETANCSFVHGFSRRPAAWDRPTDRPRHLRSKSSFPSLPCSSL